MRLCPFRVIGETALSQAQGKTGQGGILNKALSESIICLRFDSWGHNMLKFVVLESDLCELRDLSDSECIPQLLNNYFSNVTLVFRFTVPTVPRSTAISAREIIPVYPRQTPVSTPVCSVVLGTRASAQELVTVCLLVKDRTNHFWPFRLL